MENSKDINSFTNMDFKQVAINHQVELIKSETERLHKMLAEKTLLMLGVERTKENWNE